MHSLFLAAAATEKKGSPNMDAASILINATATNDDDCVSYCVLIYFRDLLLIERVCNASLTLKLFPPFMNV